MQLGSMASRTNIIMEATEGLCQRCIKGDIKDCFIFDSWSSSKKPEEAVMGVGADIIDTVKTNKKVLCY